MITFNTVNMKCYEECWMLCDDRMNTPIANVGTRNVPDTVQMMVNALPYSAISIRYYPLIAE